MLIPRIGERIPIPPTNGHSLHDARIVGVDMHGQPVHADELYIAPTLVIRCSCGAIWTTDLIEILDHRDLTAS